MNIPCRVDEMDMHADLHTVLGYHQYSKHRFEAYAPGPEALDWDDQPAAFRHFEGAEQFALPALKEAMQDTALSAALQRPFSALNQAPAPIAASAASLSVLLQLSLGITAWKSWGPDRWAVRANPSSGNLHPVEAYLFLRGIAGFADGLYHYCPDSHALERRATFTPSGGSPQVLIALSSVMWREAWKYGERAFRYCQLDTGHAVGALRYAAALLGWPLAEQRQASTSSLQHWLGLDRVEDFTAGRETYTEREEAETLLSLTTEPADLNWLQQACATASWHGKASTIDRHPMYRWQAIDEVALATRHAATKNHSPSEPGHPDKHPEPEPASTRLPHRSSCSDAVRSVSMQDTSCRKRISMHCWPPHCHRHMRRGMHWQAERISASCCSCIGSKVCSPDSTCCRVQSGWQLCWMPASTRIFCAHRLRTHRQIWACNY